MPSPRSNHTVANKILDQLLALSKEDLYNVIGLAREYGDVDAGVSGVPSGNRLTHQLTLAIDELNATKTEGA